jgi:hypothetical protein
VLTDLGLQLEADEQLGLEREGWYGEKGVEYEVNIEEKCSRLSLT